MATIEIISDNTEYALITPSRALEKLTSIDRELIITIYKTHGVILFRGFDLDQAILNKMTSRFCASYFHNKSPGRKKMTADGKTQSVNLGEAAFPLHPELSTAPWRPDICWFGCMEAPTEKGETLFCDGVKVVENLSESSRHYLQTNNLSYKTPSAADDCQMWTGHNQPPTTDQTSKTDYFTFKEDEDGQLYRYYITPALYKPLFHDSLALGNFILFARVLHQWTAFPTLEDGNLLDDTVCDEIKSVSNACTTAIQWQNGDLAMIDNSRVMHGRNSVINVNQRKILTQFGYINFHPNLKKITAQEPWRKQRRVAFNS